jgi:hypothetical protein
MKKKIGSKNGLKAEFCSCSKGGNGVCGGCGYGLGFFGAAVYYISTASSFGAGFVGVLKALIWPAFLIYELFKFLGM